MKIISERRESRPGQEAASLNRILFPSGTLRTQE